MFLNKIRNIFCVPDTKFVYATNVARAGKRGNICVGNNVSAPMCPRLPGPIKQRPFALVTQSFICVTRLERHYLGQCCYDFLSHEGLNIIYALSDVI